MTKLLSLLLTILLICHIYSEIISPTSMNETEEYYINSEYDDGHFQYDDIICNKYSCYIICDALSGCYGTSINASLSSILIIDCLEQESCKYLEIIDGPILEATINCVGDKTCKEAIINLNKTKLSIEINCEFDKALSTINGACISGEIRTFTLYAMYSDTVNINCGEYDCNEAIFYVNKANTVYFEINNYGGQNMYIYGNNIKQYLNVNCNGIESCQSTYINANNISSNDGGISVNCMDQYSCTSLDIYCPHKYTNCNLTCLRNDSCFGIDIFIHSRWNQKINLFANTASIGSFGDYIETRCLDEGYFSDTYLIYDGEQWRCYDYECCPFRAGTILCHPDMDCNINCSLVLCENHIINALDATSLYLNCAGDGCGGSKVLCPNDDRIPVSCTIYCNNSAADNICTQMNIIYNGTALNNNAIINIECMTDNACDGMNIDAIYANTVNWKCDNADCIGNILNVEYVNNLNLYCNDHTDTYYKYHKYGCHEMIINASYAKNVKLTCKTKSCYGNLLYFGNVKSIIINATNDKAFVENYLYANNAQYVKINCELIAEEPGYGRTCHDNFYYLPNYNVSWYCNDLSCTQLGTIYVMDGVSNWDWYYTNCGDCDDSRWGCFIGDYYNIYCNTDYNTYYQCSDASSSSSNNDCGCFNMNLKEKYIDECMAVDSSGIIILTITVYASIFMINYLL